MKRYWLVLIWLVFFAGACSAPYAVKTLQDEFSDPGKPLITRMMVDNFILSTADPLKLTPSSKLNAFIIYNRETNQVVDIGLTLINVRYGSTFSGNNQGWLNIREGNELILLTDTARLVLFAKKSSLMPATSSYNSITHSVDTNYSEQAIYSIIKDDFKILVSANLIKIRVFGVNGTQDYTSPINDGFLPNLKKFYIEEIESRN